MMRLRQQTTKIQKMTGLSTFAKYDLFNKFVISQILYAAEFINLTNHIEEGIQKLAKELLPPGLRAGHQKDSSAKQNMVD